MRRPRAFVLLVVGIALGAATPATAEISTATTIDGPSADVIDVGGVAMAEDGTGGLVFRKRVDGRTHVYAARYLSGAWEAPQRIDVGQNFDSSWPAIAAGNDGRLVVVWVQEFGSGTDRLFSASLDPGARRFQSPVPIDFNVGEATGTYPSIAMNRGGQAYLAYRYLPDLSQDPRLPPGYVNGDVRLQRYNGSVWSQLGQPADRNLTAPVRQPTADNSPKVGIDVTGSGLVAFQEPDDEFVDRVWARRVFSSSFGIPLLVSPQTWADQPLRGPADQFDLDIAGFGQGAIVFRQRPGERGGLKGTRIMLNTIPEQFSDSAGTFGAARIVDGAGEEGPADTGRASIGTTPTGAFVTALGAGTATLLVGGTEGEVGGPERVDDGSGGVTPDPVVEQGASGNFPGAATVAWKTGEGGRGFVAIQERRLDGIKQPARLSGARGGAVTDLRSEGSGLGDAIVAWQQGTRETAQIVAAVVDAPPGLPAVNTPEEFQTKSPIELSWEPAPNALSRVRYAVLVDDEPVAEGVTRLEAEVDAASIGDGVHEVRVVATDAREQSTQSEVGVLRIDRLAPRARARKKGGRKVAVVVTDGSRSQTSGVDAGASTISWGDGKRTRGRARGTHRYRRRGTYRIAVKTRDEAGNRRTIRLRVRV